MDFELPYMAQRRIQAKRMGRLFHQGDQEENDGDEESVLFSIASDEDGFGEWDRENQGAAALLGGRRGGGAVATATWSTSVVGTAGAAAPYPRPAPPPGLLDRLVHVVGVNVFRA